MLKADWDEYYVPILSNAILAFQQNRHDWFYDHFPRHFDSLGGRFSNFASVSNVDSIGRLSTSAISTKSCARQPFAEEVVDVGGRKEPAVRRQRSGFRAR